MQKLISLLTAALMALAANASPIYATVRGYDENNYSAVIIPYSVEYNNHSYPVERIGYKALDNMTITRINAPLKRISAQSFRYAKFENTLEIPASLDRIALRGFEFALIPYLILPEELISIWSEAFFGHETNEPDEGSYVYRVLALESRNPNPPIISENSFDPFTYEKAPLKVPYGSKKAYASAIGWRNFKNISNIGEVQEQVYDNDLTFKASIRNKIPVKSKMVLMVDAAVRNSGLKHIPRFKMAWYIDGKYMGEKHFDADLAPDETITFTEKIPIEVDYAGTHELKPVITIIGADDEDMSDNEASLAFESFDKGYFRVSLFEEFTSEYCNLTTSYSPVISAGIENSGFPDFVAQVTHHCGFYEDFLTLNMDYEWFYNDYGTYTPGIMINRTDLYDTGYSPVTSVPDDIDRKIINQTGICNALVSVSCEVEGDRVFVKTLLEKEDDFDMNAGYDYLTVYLIEDSIPSRDQIDTWTGQLAEDYYHRNTLRKILTHIWGDKISWIGNMCALKFERSIDPSWNTDNLKAVAFIHRYDPESPLNCQVYTANSSDLPQYGSDIDDSLYQSSVDEIIIQESDTFDIYNIMGVKVKSNAKDFTGLPAGLYIYNGKKIYVR